MGRVIFTGILVGTMFTLFDVPRLYTFLARMDLRHLAEKPDPKLMPALPS
jgi:multidrug efflux pump